MSKCKICSNNYSDKRMKLGYLTCIECGDKIATEESKSKARCVAPLFNKGAYQYIGNINEAKYIGR